MGHQRVATSRRAGHGTDGAAIRLRVPELEYGEEVIVRRISQQGSLKWSGERTFISEIFAHEWMGLRALDERYYEVMYGPVKVGFLDTVQHTFHRVLPRGARLTPAENYK